MKKYEEKYIITDGCMWEQNKKNSTYYPHSIEVVDEKTGQIRYIRSGSRIALIEGQITATRDQNFYNNTSTKLPDNTQDQLCRTGSKKRGRKVSKEKRSKA